MISGVADGVSAPSREETKQGKAGLGPQGRASVSNSLGSACPLSGPQTPQGFPGRTDPAGFYRVPAACQARLECPHRGHILVGEADGHPPVRRTAMRKLTQGGVTPRGAGAHGVVSAEADRRRAASRAARARQRPGRCKRPQRGRASCLLCRGSSESWPQCLRGQGAAVGRGSWHRGPSGGQALPLAAGRGFLSQPWPPSHGSGLSGADQEGLAAPCQEVRTQEPLPLPCPWPSGPQREAWPHR